MIVQIGVNNALSYTFNATAKTLTIAGIELSNLANIRSIKNTSRSNESMFVSGASGNTLNLRSVPAGSTDSDTLEILLFINGDFDDYSDDEILFNKSWSSQKIRYELNNVSGGGGSGLILTSADGTHWLVGVSDLGALTTEETADAGVSSITLTSPNETQFTLGVNDAGVLITTEV